MTGYATMIRKGIKRSGMSQIEIFLKAREEGVNLSATYLSKLQTGKTGPASDRINQFLAEMLGLDKKELLIEAYKLKVPNDVLSELVKREMLVKN
jgi:transcriptional regulator with XRE-family HTH domain